MSFRHTETEGQGVELVGLLLLGSCDMEKLSPSLASHNHNGVGLKLPPGFRFHPTDEELVVQYLRRKAFSCPLPASIIPEIDLAKYNPWDLPGKPLL